VARPSTTRATLLLLAAFVAGGLVGGAAAMGGESPQHENKGNHRERPGYAERLTNELGMTSEQRQAVEDILARYEPTMDSLMRAMRHSPEARAVRDAVRSEIRALLTPEQQERYADMLARQDRDDPRGGKGGDGR
jgi:Spy/CpxP family protein refolding chaperone